jgi:hypothetical protein
LTCLTGGVRVVNFHISSNPRAKWTAAKRRLNLRLKAQTLQVARLVGFVNELGRGRLVVAGDSNIDRTTDLYQALIGGAGLTEPFKHEPTLKGHRGVDPCVDVILHKGWGDVSTKSRHAFKNRTARWTQVFRWKHMSVVSDHEGLCLEMSGA